MDGADRLKKVAGTMREVPARLALVPRRHGSENPIGPRYRGLVRFTGVESPFGADVEEYAAMSATGTEVPVVLRIWAGDQLPPLRADQPFELFDGSRLIGRGRVGDGLISYLDLPDELVAAAAELGEWVARQRADWADGEHPAYMLMFAAVGTDYLIPLLRARDHERLSRFFAFVERMVAGPRGYRTEPLREAAWGLLDALLGQGQELETAARYMGPLTLELYEAMRGSGLYRLPDSQRSSM